MNIEFLEATDLAQFQQLAVAADEIWSEYYPALLTPEQIRYMVERFHAPETMERQMREEGYRYFLVLEHGELLGYLAVKPEEGKLFLSKAYLKKTHRGRGYFSRMLAFIEDIARERGLSAIYLMVNKDNANSIAVYCKKGFLIDREQIVDIGSGFAMDDYVMEKRLE